MGIDDQPRAQEVHGVNPEATVNSEEEKVGGTPEQLASVEELSKTINNHSRLGDDVDFRRDFDARKDLAETDWAGFVNGLKELSSLHTGEAHAVLEQYLEEHDEDKIVERTNFSLMQGPNGLSYKSTLQKIKGMEPKVQGIAAEEYFKSTIGNGEMPILGSLTEQYQVYLALKNTAFGARFRELEDERLTKYGYGPFTL